MEQEKKGVDLSVIVPAYNEGKTVSKVINALYSILGSSKWSFQVIIVDDGSKDETADEAEKALAAVKSPDDFSLVHRKGVNGGKGSAIRAGIPFVRGRYVIIQDADLENDPNDILRMMDVITSEGRKVLYGSRFMRKENKHTYKTYYLGGRLVTLVTNILYFQKLTDEPTCYKMFDADLLRSINLKCMGFEFCPEVTAKVSKKGFKIKEIPISYFPRTVEDGKKLSWKDGIEAIWVLLKYRFFR